MASRFWIGGTGTWDSSTTTHWSATTGGAGGASVPGSADTVTLDGASGGGTVTVNTTVTVLSIACGAFTGTLDFSTNNNNVTLSASGGFNGSGSGTRTINLGNGTWTLTSTSGTTVFTLATTTGLTFSANSSIIDLNGTQAIGNTQTFNGGGQTFSTVKVSGARLDAITAITNTGGTIATLNVAADAALSTSGAMTFTTLTVSARLALIVSAGSTLTITNAYSIPGSVSAPNAILSSSPAGNAGTISTASGTATIAGASIHNMTFSGGATFTASNSENLGHNTGITITPPITVQPTYQIGI